MTDALLVALVLGAVAALLWGAARLGRAFALPGEVRRKIVHFGTGLVGLALPWLFDELWPVAVIGGLSVAGLVAVRRPGRLRAEVGDSIHAVERRSYGDFVMPLAIVALFVLAEGDRLLYSVPLLVLSVADGTAALVALRYGLSPYETLDGKKSFEGSAAFFVTALLATLVPLLLFSDVGRAEVLLLSALVALLAGLIEAASCYGLDNLFIPLGTFFLLERAAARSAAELGAELLVMALLAGVVFFAARRARLALQARFCALVVGFAVWSYGGAAWLAPLVMVMVLHPLLVPLPPDDRETVDLRAVLSVTSAAAVWLTVDATLFVAPGPGLFAFGASQAAHLTMITDLRARRLGRGESGPWPLAAWSAASAAGATLCYAAYANAAIPRLLGLAAIVWLLVWATGAAFHRLALQPQGNRRWLFQGSLALVTSAAALLAHALVA